MPRDGWTTETNNTLAVSPPSRCHPFCLLATFPGWHEELDQRTGETIDIKPFPSKVVSKIVAWAMVMASLFALVSALWQHVAASAVAFAIETTTQAHLAATVGTTAMGLGWAAYALTSVVALGMVIMIASLHILDRLTDE